MSNIYKQFTVKHFLAFLAAYIFIPKNLSYTKLLILIPNLISLLIISTDEKFNRNVTDNAFNYYNLLIPVFIFIPLILIIVTVSGMIHFNLSSLCFITDIVTRNLYIGLSEELFYSGIALLYDQINEAKCKTVGQLSIYFNWLVCHVYSTKNNLALIWLYECHVRDLLLIRAPVILVYLQPH